eukprot:1152790-Pelagomonas_calceolata.AAC.2
MDLKEDTTTSDCVAGHPWGSRHLHEGNATLICVLLVCMMHGCYGTAKRNPAPSVYNLLANTDPCLFIKCHDMGYPKAWAHAQGLCPAHPNVLGFDKVQAPSNPTP